MAVHASPHLSRFFRMAVVAGVESAVQIHIDRGDDLNARDDKGMTPLMLSAARNKAAVCSLLIDAGADAGLLDPFGIDALGIAQAAGAREAASVIEASRVPEPFPNCADGSAEFSNIGINQQAIGPLAIHPGASNSRQPSDQSHFGSAAETADAPAPAIEWTSDSDNEGGAFDLSGWEAEEDQPPPKRDPTLAPAASEIQNTISDHRPIDTSADWEDFEAFLPERASPLPRADDAEARERLSFVLLRAIREGSVPRSSVEDMSLDADGAPNEEAFAVLRMVINDLGAETDERIEYSSPHESFGVFVAAAKGSDEEDTVTDALAFIDDLATRRNDPLRIYQREYQREALLTAEAEVALAQAMEYGVGKALDALASWPSGIGAVLDAARAVLSGAKTLRWMSSSSHVDGEGVEAQPWSEVGAGSVPPPEGLSEEDDSDSEFGLDAKESTNELAEFVARAELLSGLGVYPVQGTPEWSACRGALASLRPTRGFLLELADSGVSGESGPAIAFTQAMNAYRRARDQMTVANLKLVSSIAKKYLFSGQPLDDLLQEGNIGLIKAVDRYEWRRGFKFSTYATWWIRQQVGRHVADKGKTIRLPVHIHEKTQRISQAARAFEFKNGRAPTIDEIAAIVELPVGKVLSLGRAALEPLPIHELDALDELIAEDARDEFTDRDPMDIVEDEQLIASVDRLLGTLKLKEERVLRMRFGIGIADSMTLEEIGAQLGVTRERIRQIEASAIRRLKHPVRLDKLLHELGEIRPTKRDEPEEVSAEPDGELDSGPSKTPPPGALGASPQYEPSAQATPRPERLPRGKPSAIDTLLTQVRSAGVAVHDERNSAGGIWVGLTNSPDNGSHKLVRKLIALGFEVWPGKGYWK